MYVATAAFLRSLETTNVLKYRLVFHVFHCFASICRCRWFGYKSQNWYFEFDCLPLSCALVHSWSQTDNEQRTTHASIYFSCKILESSSDHWLLVISSWWVYGWKFRSWWENCRTPGPEKHKSWNFESICQIWRMPQDQGFLGQKHYAYD